MDNSFVKRIASGVLLFPGKHLKSKKFTHLFGLKLEDGSQITRPIFTNIVPQESEDGKQIFIGYVDPRFHFNVSRKMKLEVLYDAAGRAYKIIEKKL